MKPGERLKNNSNCGCQCCDHGYVEGESVMVNGQQLVNLKFSHDKLSARVKRLTEALTNAEERLFLIWIRNDDFDAEEVKHEIFKNAYEGRESARKALEEDK